MNKKVFFKATVIAIAMVLAIKTTMMAQQTRYIITPGSGTSFTCSQVPSTNNTTLQNVISNIKTHANGAACIIQFGNPLGTTLSLGSAAGSITFDGTALPSRPGQPGWGTITLEGNVTSASAAGSTTDMIVLSNGASIISDATITNNH